LKSGKQFEQNYAKYLNKKEGKVWAANEWYDVLLRKRDVKITTKAPPTTTAPAPTILLPYVACPPGCTCHFCQGTPSEPM
jgi:hypothetical protein